VAYPSKDTANAVRAMPGTRRLAATMRALEADGFTTRRLPGAAEISPTPSSSLADPTRELHAHELGALEAYVRVAAASPAGRSAGVGIAAAASSPLASSPATTWWSTTGAALGADGLTAVSPI
jgi:hypothetical protein